ncbi:MAG: hypothetical protein ACRC0J_18155 [Shewanella oncorhynchi]
MTVIDRDRGWKAIKRELEKASRLEVAVGIHAGEKNGGSATIAEYAGYNEFGTRDEDGNIAIPARPFMAVSFDESRSAIDADFARESAAMMNGGSAHESLLRIGLKHAARIKKIISTRNFLPRLAKETVRRKKGSTKTLVDTSAMINSIQPVVRGRSSS